MYLIVGEIGPLMLPRRLMPCPESAPNVTSPEIAAHAGLTPTARFTSACEQSLRHSPSRDRRGTFGTW